MLLKKSGRNVLILPPVTLTVLLNTFAIIRQNAKSIIEYPQMET
jgi:hypothetical protein